MLRTESIESLIVDSEVARDLTCCICLSLLSAPLQCKRGHLFCSQCIEQHMRTSRACPECREPLPHNKENLSRALFVEKAIRSLKVYCKYRYRFGSTKGDPLAEDDTGCRDVLPLERAKAHELECAFRYVLCPNRGCDVRDVRANQLAQHREVCEFRIVACPYCERDVAASLLQRHRDEQCESVPVDCPNCGAKQMPRKSLLAHACPEEAVPCPFADTGCAARPLRKDLEQHLAQQGAAHVLCVKNSLEAMHRRFGRMLALRDERIAVLEELVRKTRDAKMTHTLEWEVEFERAEAEVFCRSKSFRVAGFDFFFGMWPRGEKKKMQHVGVFLFMERRACDYASITADFTIAIVNQTYPQMTVVHSFDSVTFPILAQHGQGWGEDRFLPTTAVSRESGFLSKSGRMCIQSVFRTLNVQFTL